MKNRDMYRHAWDRNLTDKFTGNPTGSSGEGGRGWAKGGEGVVHPSIPVRILYGLSSLDNNKKA